jgi:hypothetical protein
LAASRFDEYVVRRPFPPNLTIQWGNPELGIIVPHFILSTSGAPVKKADTMVEFVWITKDSAFGVTHDKPPHKHDCDEIFLFVGNNPDSTDDLGAEVEFWMGEGHDTERISITTSAWVFVPGGLLHLPLFFKKVERPLLWQVLGLNVGDTLKSVAKYPLRGV